MKDTQAEQYLNKIRALEFVKDARLTPFPRSSHGSADRGVRIRTPKGTYAFTVETKSSYLDRSTLNATISHANALSRTSHHPVLLLARYIPRPSGEKLVEAGVNFVDLAGNMHLSLDNNYVRTVLGNKEVRGYSDRILTPSRVQLLFAFAAQPESVNWSVRRLSDLSGVSKSNVAKLRQQLLMEGLLISSKRNVTVQDAKELEQQLLRGYEQVLRPKILIGRFRAQESMEELLLKKFKQVSKESSVIWSLTGGPAAFLLQRYYRGVELPLFVNVLPDTVQRDLRMLPDKAGPIIVMRSFGPLTHWKTVQGTAVAHPWLIFTELMRSQDPRAHEAAVQLKTELLNAA